MEVGMVITTALDSALFHYLYILYVIYSLLKYIGSYDTHLVDRSHSSELH